MAHRVLRSLMILAAGLVATPGAEVRAGAPTPQDATYVVEGEAVTLVDGRAEQVLVPGAASRQLTRQIGPVAEPDLDGDGVADVALLLRQESGGSGTLYYVAAALRTAGGYTGTNALFLGDRIAPLELSVDPRDPASFVVTYYTRSAGEPMSAEPTERVSKAFRYEDGVLAELADALEQRP